MNGELTNDTSQIVFHILGFSTSETGRIICLLAVLLLYLTVLIGNFTIITLVCVVSQLQTSMYFFLCNLSIMDMSYVTTTLPKLLYITYSGDHAVSYTGCIAQLYFFIFFADTESFQLTAMAFDRYVAICFPLHYALIMSKCVCMLLAFSAWFMAALNALMLTCFVSVLSFLKFNEINHFFCDLKILILASSSDTTFLRKCISIDAIVTGGIPLLLILSSYACIISTILKIESSDGRLKTFSSCTSHITIVVLYYGLGICDYIQNNQEQEKYLSFIYTTMVPVLNPLVYSLRNKDIIRAMTRTFFWKTSDL